MTTTIGKRWPDGIGPDRQAICSYCGTQWRRSQLTRDASQNLACPDCAPGLDIVSLSEGNVRMMRSQQPKVVGPADGNFDQFTPPADPGFKNPNGPPGNTYLPQILPILPANGTLPVGVTPAVWLDANQQSYASASTAIPANFGFIRRLNEAPSVGGAWTSPSDAERPYRDGNSIRHDIPPGGGYQLTRPDPGGVFCDSCTVFASFVARDNVIGGQLMGLFEESAQKAGIRLGGNQVWVNTTAGLFFSGLLIVSGVRNTIAATYTAGGVEVVLNANGVIATATFAGALSHTATNTWVAGVDGVAYLYGAIVQGMVVASSLSSTLRDQTMAYLHSQPAPPAYPDSSALIAYIGDSITSGSPGVVYSQTYPFLMLPNIRAYSGMWAENARCALGGSGVNGILLPGSMLSTANSFYSATRVGNVLVWMLGDNNLAGGNSPSFTLYGTGPEGPAFPGSGLFAGIAAAKAVGWKNVLITIPPRNDVSAMAANYTALRALVNNEIVTTGRGYADSVVDARAIPGWRDGDPDNPLYYQGDKVHPTALSHANLEPAVRAAVLGLL